ncbi:hypothetical protein BC941DRAFT_430932 [Chlamydoabsidia padenii]|nr:hypothetical protein BC941DRAFT_430932 [Chlamydoabsidia padenii]
MFQDQRNQYDNNNRQRRSSTGSTWASGYPSSYRMENNDNDYDDYDYNYNNEDYGDDGADDYINSNNDTRKRDDSDDGDSLNSLEMLALENAKRNEKPPGGTPSPFDPDNLSIPLSAQMESSNNNKEQQQRHIATTRPQFEQDGPHHHYHHPTTDDPIISPPIISSAGTLTETLTNSTGSQQQQEPTKKRRWPLSYLFRKSSTGSNFSKTSYNLFMTTPSPSNSLTSSNSSDFSHHTNDSHRHIPTRQKEKQKQPSIVTYQNKMEPTAQTDQQQQRQLGDAEMTALLDNIWCFKASQVAAQLISPDNKSNVWTGFDYKNQEILTNHSIALMNDQAKTDPGLELFDSHIRKGTLPFLVVISQQLAYYPTSNDTIDKIEIKCLPNTKDTVLLRKKKLA